MFPHLHGDHSVHVALERMGAAGLTLLPIVSRADVPKLEGIVLIKDVLNAYGIGPDTTRNDLRSGAGKFAPNE